MADEKKPSDEAPAAGDTPAEKTAAETPPKAPAAKVAGAAATPKPKPKPKAPPEPPKGPEDQTPPDDAEVPGFIAALQKALPGAVEQLSFWVGDWTVIVPAARLLDVATFLRDDAAASFDYCSDVTAVDWPPRERRFDVVYCLYSVRLRHRVRIKVRAGEGEEVPSVTGLWPAANWLEREVYDQYGVNITGHPDLRRILMPDDWQGYPQRKDYPLEGPGEFLMESPQDWLRLRNLPDEAGPADDAGIE